MIALLRLGSVYRRRKVPDLVPDPQKLKIISSGDIDDRPRGNNAWALGLNFHPDQIFFF